MRADFLFLLAEGFSYKNTKVFGGNFLRFYRFEGVFQGKYKGLYRYRFGRHNIYKV